MINTKKQKHSLQGIELVRVLANQGYRVFTLHDAKKAAESIQMSSSYVIEALSLLKQQGWIEGIKKGVYAFSHESGISEPPHEFEIAQALVPESVISYWTAMRHYQMTEQLPRRTFNMVPQGAGVPKNVVSRRMCYIKVKRDYFFGIKTEWINQSKIQITDPERTLLEGLRHPEYCGGFQEVLSAFRIYFEKLDLNKIVEYACHLDAVTPKRLGWILEKLGVAPVILRRLEDLPIKGHRNLDPNSPSKGKYKAKWHLLENI